MQVGRSVYEVLELVTQGVRTADLASQYGFIENSMQNQGNLVGAINPALANSPDFH